MACLSINMRAKLNLSLLHSGHWHLDVLYFINLLMYVCVCVCVRARARACVRAHIKLLIICGYC